MNGPVNPNGSPGPHAPANPPSPRRRPSQPQIILPADDKGQIPSGPSNPQAPAINAIGTPVPQPPKHSGVNLSSAFSRPLGPQGRVHLSTLCLVVLATFDLVTTLFWLHIGFGEGNPFFAAIAARFGGIGFAIAKLIFVFVPVGILEYARTKRPTTAELGTWVAFLAYGFLYLRHLVQYFGASANF